MEKHRGPIVAVALALACVSVTREAFAQQASGQCAPHVAGGIVVTEGRGGTAARLAASSRGVVVSWLEQRPWRDRTRGWPDPQSLHYARLIDRSTLALSASATVTFSQSGPEVHSVAPVLATVSDGRIASISCMCIGGSARTGCTSRTIAGDGDVGRIRPDEPASGCFTTPIAATGVGQHLLVSVGSPASSSISLYGTALRREGGFESESVLDVPTMASVGGDRAVLVRRTPSGIEGRVFEANGRARSPATILSTRGSEVGTPFALSLGDSVAVAFAQRRGRAAWKIHITRWQPGQPLQHSDIDTGTRPAMGPSLAPAANGCLALSWTEGTGRTTVAYAGRVCANVLDRASVAPLSRPGVEAGDSEVASDGERLFAVWQEIPSARGAHAELRFARLGCR